MSKRQQQKGGKEEHGPQNIDDVQLTNTKKQQNAEQRTKVAADKGITDNSLHVVVIFK